MNTDIDDEDSEDEADDPGAEVHKKLELFDRPFRKPTILEQYLRMFQ